MLASRGAGAHAPAADILVSGASAPGTLASGTPAPGTPASGTPAPGALGGRQRVGGNLVKLCALDALAGSGVLILDVLLKNSILNAPCLLSANLDRGELPRIHQGTGR